jgi:uncharacterized damage-inducible protein DinB
MTPAEAQGLAGYLCQHLGMERQITRKILAALPEEQLNFKLGEKGRTAAQLAWHLIQSERGFAEGIAGLTFDTLTPEGQPPETAAEIVAAYDRDVTPAIERVKAMTGEQLATPVSFMGMKPLPAVFYIGWSAHHTIHHRGQLSTYLRAMNAHVPAIYGGSADEPMAAAASA